MNQILSVQFLEEQYIKMGKSTRQIAKEFYISKSTVHFQLKRQGLSRSHKESVSRGEKCHNWKGDDASIEAIHIWVKSRKIKPEFCEECKINIPKDLANISQKYKRDIDDYRWLCRSCHQNYDYQIGVRTNQSHPNLRLVDGNLRCCCCKELKSFDSFHNNIRMLNGKHPYCKVCSHKKYLQSKDGN